MSIKEDFELISHAVSYSHTSYITRDGSDTVKAASLADRMVDITRGYLRLYETTLDKGYLVKSIWMTRKMQMIRNDVTSTFGNHPGWCINMAANAPSLYQDGRILAVMAELVYIIKSSSLNSLSLPDYSIIETYEPSLSGRKLIDQYGDTVYPLFSNTYGSYADWLLQEIDETLSWYLSNGYWHASYGWLYDPGDDYGIPFNMHSGFILATYYLGMLSGYTGYMPYAMATADMYFNDVPLWEDSNCPIASSDHCFEFPVLQVNQENAYEWYQGGWQLNGNYHVPCLDERDKCSEYMKHWDDMSHALHGLDVPLLFHQFDDTLDFNDQRMARFHNTFTENLYDGSGNFYPCVNGTVCDLYVDQDVDEYLNSYKYRAFAYMPLYAWDGSAGATGNVYEIVMDMYTAERDSLVTFDDNVLTGADVLGIARTAEAQWAEECVNLTLHRRKMVYDQDFHVKNTLTVDPINGPAVSFAEPLTQVPEFRVDSGVTVVMAAGEGIILKPGFRALSGSKYSATIQANPCSDGVYRQAPVAPAVTPPEMITSETRDSTGEIELHVVPNPSNGQFNIRLESDQPFSGKLTMFSLDGRPLWNRPVDNSGSYQFNHPAAVVPGFYLVRYKGTGGHKTVKVIIH